MRKERVFKKKKNRQNPFTRDNRIKPCQQQKRNQD